MTNLDYIMQSLTERDIATFIEEQINCMPNPGSLLARRACLAFKRWRYSLSENQTQGFYVDDEHNLQPSVFATNRFYFYAGTSTDPKKRMATVAVQKTGNSNTQYQEKTAFRFKFGSRSSTTQMNGVDVR